MFLPSKCETFYPFVHTSLFISFCQFCHYRCLLTCTVTVKTVKTLSMRACVHTEGRSTTITGRRIGKGEGREVHGKPKQALHRSRKDQCFLPLSLSLSPYMYCEATTYQTLHCRQQAKKNRRNEGTHLHTPPTWGDIDQPRLFIDTTQLAAAAGAATDISKKFDPFFFLLLLPSYTFCK